MAPPNLSEDEIDDLVYLARAGEDVDLTEMLRELSSRENATPADILAAARDGGHSTCLHMAAANGHAKTVTLLLSNLPAKTSSMTRPSTSEAMHKTAEPAESADKVGDSAKQTTDETSYIDAPNEFGNTALHWACLGGHLDVVQLLLSRGASPAVPNHKDQIPLDLAAFNNHMHVVEHFLAQSRDLEDGNAKEGGLDSGAQDLAMADDVTRGADRPDRAES